MYHYKIFVKHYCADSSTTGIKPIWKTYPQPFNEQLQIQLENDLTTTQCFCEIGTIEFLGQSNEICNQASAYLQPITSIIATHNSGCANDQLPTPTSDNSNSITFRIT